MTLSLSTMATVANDGVAKVAPDGSLRVTRKSSLPSAYESSMIATENDLEVSPAAKDNVPMVTM